MCFLYEGCRKVMRLVYEGYRQNICSDSLQNSGLFKIIQIVTKQDKTFPQKVRQVSERHSDSFVRADGDIFGDSSKVDNCDLLFHWGFTPYSRTLLLSSAATMRMTDCRAYHLHPERKPT